MNEQTAPHPSALQRINELEAALDAERARRGRLERVLAAHHRLSELEPNLHLDTLLQHLLAQVEELTGSTVSFFHLFAEDQQTISLQTWSERTLTQSCRASRHKRHYPVSEAGVWADCIHGRRPVIHNDFSALSHRRGQPEGHATLVRELVAPILRGEQIVAIIGVGNKEGDYTGDDVELVTKLGDLAWDLVLRKREESRLRESEERFRRLIDEIPMIAIQGYGPDGRVRFWNPASEQLYGYSREEALGRNLLDLIIPPKMRDTVAMDIEAMAKIGTPIPPSELTLMHKDGSPVAVFSSHALIRSADGEAELFCVDVDLSERKRIEQVQGFLAQAHSGHNDEPFFNTLARYLAQILDMEFVCIDLLEGDGLTARTVAVWHNDRFEDNVTYALKDTPCGDVVGNNVCCFAQGVAARFPDDQVLQDLHAESYVGVTLWSHTGQPIGLIAVIGHRPLRYQAAAETILQMVAVRAAGELERQLAEETRQTILKRFEIMLTSLYPGVLVVSDAGRVEFINPSFRALFNLDEPLEQLIGCLPEQLLAKMVQVAVDPPGFLGRIRDILTTREPVRAEEIAISGDRTYLRDFVPIVIDGRQYGRLWLYTDITERRRVVNALRVSEQRLRNYFELGLIGMTMTSTDKRFLHFNDRLCEILGYPRQELYGKTWLELTHPDDQPQDLQRFGRIERLETDIFHTEKRFIRKDGTIVHAEVISRCVRGKDGTIDHYVAMIQDITARKLSEEKARILRGQLLQSQKLEAIGTLAGGIAHDFNNILAAVIGYTDMAKEIVEPGTQLAKDLDQVLKAGHRAKELVRQILVFSRQSETEPIDLMPANIVKEVIKLLRPSLPTTIAIEQKISPKAGPVHIDPTQLHQILMNLCTNAFHAMEERGGNLSITLNNTLLDADNLPSTMHAKPGNYVELMVSDTGSGIPASIRNRIFDPFFTTKEMGKGTGMGLSIVHGIVTGYNGFIDVESTPGSGTTFRIFLPMAAQADIQERSESEPVPQGSEHILFVDDEEVLAEMVESMLERLGYRVTVRTSSLEALNTFRNHPDLFDVVITDQTMPGMTGLDLARRILTLRPNMPIILCTGYSTLISEEEAKAYGIRAFALKPLTKKDMAVLIRRVLSEE